MSDIASKILQLKERRQALVWQQNQHKTQEYANQLAKLKDHVNHNPQKMTADLMRNNSYFKQRLNQAINLQTKELIQQQHQEHQSAKNWQKAYAKLNAYCGIIERNNKIAQTKITINNEHQLDELVVLQQR